MSVTNLVRRIISITPAVDAAMRQLAERSDRPISAEYRRAVAAWLKAQERKGGKS